jgi:hypothetical protein
MFEPLNDHAAFRQFAIVGHTLGWQSGADMAPEYLRELAAQQIGP